MVTRTCYNMKQIKSKLNTYPSVILFRYIMSPQLLPYIIIFKDNNLSLQLLQELEYDTKSLS